MKTPQGKRFNAGVSNINDPDWQSVQTLPDGNGYRYSRDWFTDLYDDMLNWADEIIFVCHVKDKYIGSKIHRILKNSVKENKEDHIDIFLKMI